MNTRHSLVSRLLPLIGLCVFSAGTMRATEYVDAGRSTQAAEYLNQAQLDRLLGPIALYPDALIALILPASTSQADVVLAARFLSSHRDSSQIDSQPWSESVRALARYPEVILWMDENLQWTQELGAAFYNQPTDVMNAVQRLRAIARSNGVLVNTAQQQVVVEDDVIEIIPAQPDVIYIPRYDPEIVYVSRLPVYSEPYLTFGFGFAAGMWLSYDFDWRHRVICVGDRRDDWRNHRDWRRDRPRNVVVGNSNWHRWQPPANRPRPPRDYPRPGREIVQPRMFDRGTTNYARREVPAATGNNSPRWRDTNDGRRDRGDRQNSNNNALPQNRLAMIPEVPNTSYGPAVAQPRATPVDPQRATPQPTVRQANPPSEDHQRRRERPPQAPDQRRYERPQNPAPTPQVMPPQAVRPPQVSQPAQPVQAPVFNQPAPPAQNVPVPPPQRFQHQPQVRAQQPATPPAERRATPVKERPQREQEQK